MASKEVDYVASKSYSVNVIVFLRALYSGSAGLEERVHAFDDVFNVLAIHFFFHSVPCFLGGTFFLQDSLLVCC